MARSNYFIVTISGEKNIPLVCPDEDCPFYNENKVIENPELITYKFAPPIPRKPILADYHPETHPLVSKKIFDALEPLNTFGVQFLPAIMRDKSGNEYENYWQLYIYNVLECVDLNLSVCSINEKRGTISGVRKLVLDMNALEKIDLNKRLIFRLKEKKTYKIFHEKLVEKISAANPTGLRFVPIEEWSIGSYFK